MKDHGRQEHAGEKNFCRGGDESIEWEQKVHWNAGPGHRLETSCERTNALVHLGDWRYSRRLSSDCEVVHACYYGCQDE